MRFSERLPVVLLATAIVVVQPIVASALTAAEVYPIAQQITVRIDAAK
ncbi:hypothetical protein F7734_16515 [Scytonema sp. UIC 10036]|nr:hypothetical protein [Scytonema sp. UIC 10036]MUG93913.1 hypothetical protein [Scytonema sp. UIC 10036]